MTFIGWGREAFTLEDMAQVSAARSASDLRPRHAILVIIVTSDGSGDRVEERRPSTSTVELCRALVQRGTAPGARVDTLLLVLVVLASAGGLGALLAEDAELLSREDGPPLAVALVRLGHISVLEFSRVCDGGFACNVYGPKGWDE